MMLNFYEILNLELNATEDDIKRSYKKLILKYHPDKGGDTEKFHALKEAYDTLKDQDKRRKYDLTLQQNPRNISTQVVPASSNPQPNIHVDITITLEDILSNKVFTLTPQRIFPCETCHGTGLITHRLVECSLCDGAGKLGTILGGTVWCAHCGGRGKIPYEIPHRKCGKCFGKRYVKKIETFYIPAFHCVMHSLQYPHKNPMMVFYGLGNVLPGKPPGDFIIHFKETQHPDIRRKQLNLVYEKYLTLYDALFGLTFDIKIPTGLISEPTKTIRVTLDPITDMEGGALQGKWFTQLVKGEGLQTPDKLQKGDLKVQFKIIIPDIHNDQDKQTLKSLFMSSQRSMKDNENVHHKRLHISKSKTT